VCEGSKCKAGKPGDSCYIERMSKERAGPTWTQGKDETRVVGRRRESKKRLAASGSAEDVLVGRRLVTVGQKECVVGKPEGVAAARAREIDKEKKRVVKE